MEFYDVGAKKRFSTNKFTIQKRNGRKFAVAKSPTGKYDCWKAVKD